jgi:hypothetical protein
VGGPCKQGLELLKLQWSLDIIGMGQMKVPDVMILLFFEKAK